MKILVQEADFDVNAELCALSASHVGALVSFVGLVRGNEDEQALTALTLEHYPGMTERALHQLAKQAQARWLCDISLIHRVGYLPVETQIVLVAVASPHREAAFRACEFLIDALKTRAPFWKQAHFADGSSRWIDAKAKDALASARW